VPAGWVDCRAVAALRGGRHTGARLRKKVVRRTRRSRPVAKLGGTLEPKGLGLALALLATPAVRTAAESRTKCTTAGKCRIAPNKCRIVKNSTGG
jgi:hypothetical protein